MHSMAFIARSWAMVVFGLITTTFAQNSATTLQYNDTGPLSQFQSRPDLQAPFLNITHYDERHVTPGYIFMAPYQTNQGSIYIYDTRGNLVYSGFGPAGGGIYHNFHVCKINGTDHLCFFNGNQFLGFGRGHGVIMDNTLSYHSSVQGQAGLGTTDEHEFNVVDDGKAALLSVYETAQHDMSSYNITGGQGWVISNWFQKIDLATNELLFEWSALDHVDISETWIKPNSTDISGTGLSPFSPFDWFHINSVDPFPNGDYLVSSRHTSTIFRIDGKDGSVVWRLGGSSSDFSFAKGLNFTFQHDARLRFQNDTHTIISIFDNASNQFNQSSRYSSGKVLSLDHTDNSCSQLALFIAPNEFIAPSQGNVQMLSPQTFIEDPTSQAWKHSNYFVGWGAYAFMSEYLPNGTEILRGHFATNGAMNYRWFKSNFTTNPTDAPASYVYAHTESAPTVFYMSWNGATEAAQWRIHTSESKNGPFETIATVDKQGFETIFVAPHYHAWSIIESLDKDGNHLRNSTRASKTFVPSQKLAKSCNMYECPVVSQYASGATGKPQKTGPEAPGSASSAAPSKNAAEAGFRNGRIRRHPRDWIVMGASLVLLGSTLL